MQIVLDKTRSATPVLFTWQVESWDGSYLRSDVGHWDCGEHFLQKLNERPPDGRSDRGPVNEHLPYHIARSYHWRTARIWHREDGPVAMFCAPDAHSYYSMFGLFGVFLNEKTYNEIVVEPTLTDKLWSFFQRRHNPNSISKIGPDFYDNLKKLYLHYGEDIEPIMLAIENALMLTRA